MLKLQVARRHSQPHSWGGAGWLGIPLTAEVNSHQLLGDCDCCYPQVVAVTQETKANPSQDSMLPTPGLTEVCPFFWT